jgi:hypothetical protein
VLSASSAVTRPFERGGGWSPQSLDFDPSRKTVAIKVTDSRGNEVMKVHRIGRNGYGV